MDSIIPLRQKNTLAEYMILSGADNRPPMLDKDLYDSWKSRMELYMQNRMHGRMILESVENTDCDMKATNIILQGLPADIYSLVNHHRVSKDLWERVQLLMHGASLTKQERECKLYDAFDKFTHIKGESLHKYYLRFTQLINDINIYNMKMEQFQVNTKFLNSLPPEWILAPSQSALFPYSRLSEDFGKRFAPQQEMFDEQASHPITDQSASSPVKIEAPQELPKVKNNRKAHESYLKHTMEQAAILRELLGYVRDTCPDIHKPSEKLVAVTSIYYKEEMFVADTVTSSGQNS
ncbi:hypothetical protein Tco_0866037 [Tanacetum coccineum]